MIFRTASCQKAARCCYALLQTEMPLSAVRDDYVENYPLNIVKPYNNFYGECRKLLAVVTL